MQCKWSTCLRDLCHEIKAVDYREEDIFPQSYLLHWHTSLLDLYKSWFHDPEPVRTLRLLEYLTCIALLICISHLLHCLFTSKFNPCPSDACIMSVSMMKLVIVSLLICVLNAQHTGHGPRPCSVELSKVEKPPSVVVDWPKLVFEPPTLVVQELPTFVVPKWPTLAADLIGTVESWQTYNGRNFTFISNTTTWYGAQMHCLSLGGSLATIHNAVEADFVRKLAELQVTWIGLISDAANDGQWLWVNNDTLTFTNWCKEPIHDRVLNCGVTNTATGDCWEVAYCNFHFPFVCVKKSED